MPGMLMVGMIPGTSRKGGCVLGGSCEAGGSEEELVVAGPAVHLVAVLTEGAFLQLAQAVGADEVLGVVLAPRGCDAAASHGAATAVADAALPLVEVQLTVGPTLHLEEGATGEAAQAFLGRRRWGMLAPPWGHAHPRVPPGLTPTHRTHEALRVPDALQCRQVIVRHRVLAALAFWGKHGQEVLAAVRLPAPLMETCGGVSGWAPTRTVWHGHGGAQDKR